MGLARRDSQRQRLQKERDRLRGDFLNGLLVDSRDQYRLRFGVQSVVLCFVDSPDLVRASREQLK
jgi:hypothetical protein